MMHRLVILFLLNIGWCHGIANSFVARSLGSHMALQRDTEIYLYGYSTAPENTIIVDFNLKQYQALSNREAAVDGGYFWKVSLPPMPGSFTGYSINITSTTGEQASLTDVVFGDVFLCSGQSNMQYGIPDMFNGTAEVADADNYPNIRVYSVKQDYCMPQAEEPLEDVYTVSLPWSKGSSKSVGGYYFSAVCWMYGKNLYNNVIRGAYPVGLVHSSWGGTIIQAWGPQASVDACPSSSSQATGNAVDVIDPLPKKVNDCAFDPNRVESLYNTMIMPLKDLRFTAAVWYQGESNTGYPPEQYACLQKLLISEWRKLWGESFGFIYTQLSTWTAGGGYVVPNFRNMQATFGVGMERVAMISAADIGDPESPYGDIHPRNKTEVGRRMALAASSILYDEPLPHSGPWIESFEVVEIKRGLFGLRLKFNPFSCGSTGLYLQAAQECPDASEKQNGGCGKVLLKYNFGHEEEATISLSSSTSIDITPKHSPLLLSKPIGVSYGQGDYPLMSVYNAVGAPLIPFVLSIE